MDFCAFKIIDNVIPTLTAVLPLNILVYEGNQVLWHGRIVAALKTSAPERCRDELEATISSTECLIRQSIIKTQQKGQ